MQNKEFYEFLDFRLDPEGRLLRREGRIVSLTVKEFELLLLLVENAGRVVSKDTLLDTLWADTFVEEGTLTRHISYLRKKLTAAGRSAEPYIETLPKRGYRFLPSVTKSGEAGNEKTGREIEPLPTENRLVIEAQTLTRINIDERVSVRPEADAGAHGQLESGTAQLLPAAQFTSGKWLRPVFLALAAAAFVCAGLTIIYFNFIRKAPAAVILTTRAAPFSGLPGREDMPAFSPDGKQLAFSWNGGDSKTTDIYIKLIGEGEPVRLTDKNHDAVYPAFAPDGKRIAYFLSYPDRSEIYTISALGGAERKIAEVRSGGTSLSWSPDGKFIAVADRLSNDSASTGIFLIDVETGGKQSVTAPPANFRDFSPRFAADGQSLVFIHGEGDRQDLYVTKVTGNSEPLRLTFDETKILGLAWSADGREIVFNSKRQLAAPNLWRISATGGEPELIVTNAKNPTNLALAPDGKSLAYVESLNEFNVARYDLDPSKMPAAPAKFISYIRRDHNPQISPDGSLLAFNSDRTGENEIWLSDAEGKNQRQLTASHGLAGSPRFAPDGKSIAYDLKINGKGDIYIISTEGGQPRQLTFNPAHDVLPSWSADGQWIYFCSDRSGEYQLWKTPADGTGEAAQLTKQGGVESAAAPDGKTIYYLKENGTGGVWSIPAAGGEEKTVAEISGPRFWRSWAVTETGIFFIDFSENDPYQIKFYNFADHRVTQTASAENRPISIFPALSTNLKGSVILFSQQDQNATSIMLAKIEK